MKSKSTWFVIADGSRGRFYINKGPGTGLAVAMPSDLIAESVASRKMTTDRPGRSSNHATGSRHSMSPKSDVHDLTEQDLAHEIGELLDEKQKKAAFDQLVLVAAPRMLGLLRAALSDNTKKLVVCECDKDLTKVSEQDLPEHLTNLNVGVRF